MSIDRVPFPATVPVADTDWTDMVNLLEFLSIGIEKPANYDFSSDTVKQGVMIMIGGTVYQATTDTAITGTPSEYVKITPSGATASAAYVANLTGVTWNSVYNHYEDVSGNGYLFDEAKALGAAEISSAHGLIGKFADGPTTINGKRLITSANYVHTASITDNDLFDKLAPFLPNTGDTMVINGATTALGNLIYINRAVRTGAATISLYGYDTSTSNVGSAAIADGDTSTQVDCTLSW